MVYPREGTLKVLNLKAVKDQNNRVVHKFLEEGSLYQGKEEINPEKTNFDGCMANFLRLHQHQNTVCFNILTEKKALVDKEIVSRPKLILKIITILDKTDYMQDFPVFT